jgi:large subunit ribosomal protein L25
MAEKFVVKVEKREGRGTNFARRLRHQGKIPANVYGGGEDTLAITAELKDLAAVLRSDTGANTLITLDIEGKESRVIFQERQIDPVTGRLVHADLRRLSKGEKIEVTVPVHLVGNPIGVRDEGGLLEQQMREINVKCTPSNIPEAINIDVENLAANHSISIEDVTVDDEIEILESPESIVASVVFVKELDLEAPEEDELAQPELVGEESEETDGSGDDGTE